MAKTRCVVEYIVYLCEKYDENAHINV
jgi:hypothetical protein